MGSDTPPRSGSRRQQEKKKENQKKMADDGVKQKLLVQNRNGLHGRASAKLVETARRFAADIWLGRDGTEVDCKNILDVMSLACVQGTPITIRAQGKDAEEALEALRSLVHHNFNEE